jgi:hypothetical protein
MKRIVTLVVGGLLALGAMQKSASATDYDIGTIVAGGAGEFTAGDIGTNTISFNDKFTFSLLAPLSDLTGGLTDLAGTVVFGSKTFVVDGLSFFLDLFSAGDPVTSLGHFEDLTGNSVLFSYSGLAAGDYFFKVHGQTVKGGVVYDLNFDTSQTPIPPAALMFITALMGLGYVSYRRRAHHS